jgi:hypothetical protein
MVLVDLERCDKRGVGTQLGVEVVLPNRANAWSWFTA